MTQASGYLVLFENGNDSPKQSSQYPTWSLFSENLSSTTKSPRSQPQSLWNLFAKKRATPARLWPCHIFWSKKDKKKKRPGDFLSRSSHTHIHTHTHTHTHLFTCLSPWKYSSWTSLVVQCLRSFLSMQGTWVQVLVREDSACCRSSKPVHCKYWSPSTLDPMMCNKRSHCNEKPVHHSSGVAPACWN